MAGRGSLKPAMRVRVPPLQPEPGPKVGHLVWGEDISRVRFPGLRPSRFFLTIDGSSLYIEFFAKRGDLCPGTAGRKQDIMTSKAAQYARHASKKATPQTEKAHPDQQENNAGGFSFVVDDWMRLERFLVLGAEGGTYYVGERKLTKDNAACVERCLTTDPSRAVETIVRISVEGRAPKNDPAIFALAMAASHDSSKVRKLALEAMPKVCRIGTHLFSFAACINEMRGWGRGLRKAVARWYDEKSVEKLTYQVLKYQQRNGWSHRDVLRLAHPTAHQSIYRWCVGGIEAMGPREIKRKDGTQLNGADLTSELPSMLAAYETLKGAENAQQVIQLIGEHGFTHEMIPTQFKKDPKVWGALLEKMPMTAMIRNLGVMTACGLDADKTIESRLMDETLLQKARIHPLNLLIAMKVYQSGGGHRGKLKWAPKRRVVDALDAGFYLSFKNIEPTGKRTMLALDISGSMVSHISGNEMLSCREASAAMAMVTARTEEDWMAMGFCSSGFREDWMAISSGFLPLDISPRQRLDDVVKNISGLPMGGTDCSLPMLYAMNNGLRIDSFIVYTDSETWAGHTHPHQALKQYRQQSGIDAKLVVVGMNATNVTIADPNDPGMLDVVGFDTAAPGVIADFVRGPKE